MQSRNTELLEYFKGYYFTVEKTQTDKKTQHGKRNEYSWRP